MAGSLCVTYDADPTACDPIDHNAHASVVKSAAAERRDLAQSRTGGEKLNTEVPRAKHSITTTDEEEIRGIEVIYDMVAKRHGQPSIMSPTNFDFFASMVRAKRLFG